VMAMSVSPAIEGNPQLSSGHCDPGGMIGPRSTVPIRARGHVVPQPQAAHMTASDVQLPTRGIVLASRGPSTHGSWMRREASAQGAEIRQFLGIECIVDGLSELGLAGPVVSECQQPDHGSASLLLATAGQQCFKGAPVGAAREELLTIDQVEQSHGLAQGMDDVPVIDDMAVLAIGMWPATAQRHQRCRAEEAFESIVMKAHPQAVADQARWHRIEDFLEDEPAGRGDGDDRFLITRRPPRRQRLQRWTLELEPLAVARIAAPDDLVVEATTAIERVEIA
jgi:hypothetical protein